MCKKYELLKDKHIEYRGKTLYRIKALRDFYNVKKGDIGGYVESEKNLSHDGNCWVYDNAKVCDNAIVFNNGVVCGNAMVCDSVRVYNNSIVCGNVIVRDNAIVCSNAMVCDNAIVCCSARVCENAEIYGNSKIDKGIIIGKVSMPYKDIFQHQCEKRMLTAILTEDDEILYTICCQENITKEEFLDRIYNEGGGLKGNPHREEYLRLIPVIEMYFKGYK